MSTYGIEIKDINGVTTLDTTARSVSIIAQDIYISGTLIIAFDPLFTDVSIMFQPIYPSDTTNITNMPAYEIDYQNSNVTFSNGNATTETLILVLGK